MKLKPISQQVMVVTGAGAGLGLAIARRASQAGAAVVLVDRDEAAVRKAAAEIAERGGRAYPAIGDARDPREAARLARTATARFGSFDTWINVAEPVAALENAAREAARSLAEQGGGAIVTLAHSGAGLSPALRRELRRSADRLALTTIILPSGWTAGESLSAAAAMALRAAQRPMGRLAFAPSGELSLLSRTRHRPLATLGLGLGLGMAAVVAAWALYERKTAQAEVRRTTTLPRRGRLRAIFTTP